jgi:tetratricopeptide (TPR) repeat protein
MDAAVAGLIGVAIGAIGGLIAPIVNLRVSEKLSIRERKAEHGKWQRERLQEIYSNSIDCLTDSPMNCSEAKKWLNLLLIYHSSRDAIEYLDLYERVLNLSEQSPDWIAKELTATIIEMAASDKRLMGEQETGEYSAAYWTNLGRIYLNRHRYVDAEAYFDRALETNPKYSLAYYYKGEIFRIQTNYDEAIKCYNEGIKNNHRCCEAMNKKAQIYIQLKEYNNAMESANNAILINPEYADAYFNLHIALNHLGKYDDATKAYDRAIELNPNLGISG